MTSNAESNKEMETKCNSLTQNMKKLQVMPYLLDECDISLRLQFASQAVRRFPSKITKEYFYEYLISCTLIFDGFTKRDVFMGV